MKLCLWADLKPEHIAALDAAVDEAGTQQVLAQALQLVPEDNPLRHSVLLEFYVNNVRFARENGFSIEKLSAFFSIMKRNHDEMCVATGGGAWGQCPMESGAGRVHARERVRPPQDLP